DPWYDADNLSLRRPGHRCPERSLVLIAHKDSQSWVDCPGAYDNGVGTVALLEIARVLAAVPLDHSLWLLWCNEEHTPWTSYPAALAAAERGEQLDAIFNIDSLGGRSEADHAAGRRTNVSVYTHDEGRPFAELITQVVADFGLPLATSVATAERPNDDDGMFINAGYRHAIKCLGSWPYAHRWYHDERDDFAGVDIENVALATRAVVAALLRLDGVG
ncbi:MAG: M28 family peptidase, partial [Armatimonadetes bacterium]|nr:M28 family peptidase [Armatimonadota bacterium]